MAIGTGADREPKTRSGTILSAAKNRLVMATVNAAFGPNVQIMVAQYNYEGRERAKNCWRDGSELAEPRGGIIRGGGLRRGLRVGR
jgi:hypothetical protein